MKKILLGTSALALAALAAAPAVADSNVDGAKFKVSGSMDYYWRTSDNDGANVGGKGNEIKLHTPASEIHFDFNDVADNGLEYGARVEWRYSSGVDEAWMEFGGNWGTVYFGDQDGAVDGRQIAGASVLAKGLHDTGRWMSGLNLSSNDNDYDNVDSVGLVGESGDASKIYYETPSFSGFSVAASYTPDTSSSFGAGSSDDSGFQNVVEASARYDAEFNGVGLGLMVGALHGDAQSFDGNSATAGADLESDVAWLAGAKVDFAGFEVAAGYGDRGDNGCLKNTNCDMGKFYDLGVAYNFDALKVGAAYFHSELNQDGLGSDDELDTFGVEANYTVAEGLSTYAGVMWANSDDGDTANDDNDSTVFVIGTAMSF
ncbi:porin [Aestuariispira ectoiniformans]|uniref:porin n=1 Tax=Aestuariispira ectoiniformans TaxID=2775080 RepID=UPI00223BB35A|nr:porin [Aestuariispira ectoiniformans]